MVPTKEEWARALAERHGVELQKKFSSAAVAVCGLGGLGSNIAVSLARAGVGRLMLIDFDRVDLTNRTVIRWSQNRSWSAGKSGR